MAKVNLYGSSGSSSTAPTEQATSTVSAPASGGAGAIANTGGSAGIIGWLPVSFSFFAKPLGEASKFVLVGWNNLGNSNGRPVTVTVVWESDGKAETLRGTMPSRQSPKPTPGVSTITKINPSSVTIPWTPTRSGKFIARWNSSGFELQGEIVVAAAPVITSPLPGSVLTASLGQAFSGHVMATNSPTSFSATGLPAGLSFNAKTGAWSGTPTVAGGFSVTFSAKNAYGQGEAAVAVLVTDPDEVAAAQSWWATRDAGRLRRIVWVDKYLEKRFGLWWIIRYNPVTKVIVSEAVVTAADFTLEDFDALDWVTTGIPGDDDAAEARNNWRWAGLAARAGLKVKPATWERKYLEFAANLWHLVTTSASGGVLTRRVVEAGDFLESDFRLMNWTWEGIAGQDGTGAPPPDNSVIFP